MDETVLIDKWLEFKTYNQGRSHYTTYYYRRALTKLRDYLQAERTTLLAATAERLEAYGGRHLHEQGLRPISRRVIIAAIRGFYGWLHQRRMIAVNPAACLSPPKAGQPLPKAMPLAHAEKLLMQPGIKTFIGLRDTAMLAILIGCGCRVSGLVALNELDLLWTQSESGTERLDIRITEKGKKERIVPVPLETSLLIRAYLGHPQLDEIDRTLPTGDRVLFVATRNPLVAPHNFFGELRRISKHSAKRMVRRYCEQVGIPRMYGHAHAIRHLYGAELAEEGVDLVERQALLGHANPRTTAIYSHLAVRRLRGVVDKANPMHKIKAGPSHALAQRLRNRLGQ